MGLTDFRIVFDNPWATYSPGQTITGKIIVCVDAVKKIRGINLKIKGEANTCWAVDKQELNNEGRYENESETVSGHEEYFSVDFYIVGSSAGSNFNIPIGEHIYPFSFVLPPSLPSSFEHEYGHVRYTAKAILDRPMKFDQETKTAFTVISNFDLNKESRASEPVHLEGTKTFCCLCCASAPLKVSAMLPVKGYVPGQTMSIRVNVENQSGVIVDNVKLILRKVITFRARNPKMATKTEKIIISEVSKGPVEAGGTSDYEQKLEIPPLPPSNLTNCSIIDLEYNLKIKACVQGWYHRDLRANTVVFIGTVPLANFQGEILPSGKTEAEETYTGTPADPTYGGYPSGYPPFSPDGANPTAPPLPNYNSGQPAQMPNSNHYPNIPPPSYEEYGWSVRSLRERGESEHVMGNQGHFAPRYPVYNFAKT